MLRQRSRRNASVFPASLDLADSIELTTLRPLQPSGEMNGTIIRMSNGQKNRGLMSSISKGIDLPGERRTSRYEPVRVTLLMMLSVVAMLSGTSVSLGQQYPARGYYVLQGENSVYHQGDLVDAKRGLRTLYTGAYREGNVRWIDSAAYQAMAGEIEYQMGNYDAAMSAFDEAIVIYLNMVAWTTRVDWATQQRAQADNNAVRAARINWGQPTRNAAIGRFPPTYAVRFGQDIIVPTDNGNTRIPQERLVPVDVIEICRAMALALHRRDEILGPLSTVDETSRLLRAQLSEARNLAPAPIPMTLTSILYGVAAAGDGEYRKSSEILKASLSVEGKDHPLTPVALMQIGYNAYMNGDYKAAKSTLLEASYSAAYFNQFDVFRESLGLAARAHMAVNLGQPMPELAQAAEWARLHGLRMAQAQFATLSAENSIENGSAGEAIDALSVARGLMRTTNLARSNQFVRLALLENIAAVISGNSTDVSALRRDLETYRNTTLWWYRVEYLRNPARRRNLTSATLSALVKGIARDPLPDDWQRDPIDTLAFLTGDRSDFVTDDLDLQVSKKSFSDALLTSEYIRRMEFLYQCPLGGRLTSLRELVTSQPAELTPDLLRRQTEVRSRFPGIETMLEESQQLRTQLDKFPVNPPEDQQRDWVELVNQWQSTNNALERSFVAMSVRREALPLMFPPPVDLERVQKSMPEKTICMVIKQSRGTYHVFLVTRDTIAFQSTLNAKNVNTAIRGLAKLWGHTNPNAVLQKDVIQSNQWKKLSNATLTALVPKSTPGFWGSFDELVVVPDGQFWYLPFETLSLESIETSELLIDKLAVRYAPSFSLAFSEPKPRRLDRVAFYPGLIDAKDDERKEEEFAEQFVKLWPKTMEIEQSELTSDQMGPLVDAMVVWNEIKGNQWPLPGGDKPRKNEIYRTLNFDAWPYLPNNGPYLLMVDGANTAMASGVRKGTDTGKEIGYYATLLMAAGCRSVVLPRWRTGGNIPYEMQLKLAEEIQQPVPTAQAVRNAMQAIREKTLDPGNQPRVRIGKNDTDIKADHPFFWSGWMVIDRGCWYGDQRQDAPKLQLGGGTAAEAEADKPADNVEGAGGETTPSMTGPAADADKEKEAMNDPEKQATGKNDKEAGDPAKGDPAAGGGKEQGNGANKPESSGTAAGTPGTQPPPKPLPPGSSGSTSGGGLSGNG